MTCSPGRQSRSASGRRPSACLGDASLHDRELVRGQMEPRADLAARPRDADIRASGVSESKVDPAELATSVAATDRELAPHDLIADTDLDPCPDRARVRSALR